MRKITFVLCIVAMAFSVAAQASRDKSLRVKESERDVLIQYLDAARDSLQLLTVEYYALKQRGVDQREADKEEFEKLRERQERLSLDLSRYREETLTREQLLEEGRKKLSGKQDEIRLVGTTVAEIFKKEADDIIETFPLDREARRRRLESARSHMGTPDLALRSLVDYKLEFIAAASAASMVRQTILPDDGESVELALARFGSLFAYGVDASGTYYVVRQTGRLGAARYAVEKIESLELTTDLSTTFPLWASASAVSGPILFDIMQNDQSRALISGRKADSREAIRKFIKAGGPIMLPMALITLWAMVIVVIKLITLMRKHKSDEKFYRSIISHLDKRDIDKATSFAANQRGVVARVARTCLAHSKWSRESAEKAIREILVEEVPILGKHLNTLAVIATAAPLLGLLGTVTGMINVFEVITHYGTGDPKILAGGISEALVTTMCGLIIAVPVVLLHNYLRNRKDDIQSEMERHAIGILNRLWP